MFTRTDGERYVMFSLGFYVEEHFFDAMIDDMYTEAGSWDFSTIDQETYWEIASSHANGGQGAR